MRPIYLTLIHQYEKDAEDIRLVMDKLSLYYRLTCYRGPDNTQLILKAQKGAPDIVLIDGDLSVDFIEQVIDLYSKNKNISCFLLVSLEHFASTEWKDFPGLSGVIHKPFSLSGPATSGSLKLVMDLMNRRPSERYDPGG